MPILCYWEPSAASFWMNGSSTQIKMLSGFNVRVDDATLGVQIGQTFENLYRIKKLIQKSIIFHIIASISNLADDGLDVEQRNALVLAAYDEFEKIVAEHFKDHTDVRSINAADFKIIKKLDRLLAFRVRFIALADATEQLDLVQRRLRVMRRALDHLERHKPFRPVRK